MTTAESCTVSAFHRGGKAFALIRFGSERPRWGGKRCSDCGVHRGGFHHPGCDDAQCPACRVQQISCGCCFDEWGEAAEDDDVDDELSEDEEIARAVELAEAWTRMRAAKSD